MVKPLIPIIFLAMWAILFEDKIWPDWENEEAIKFFDKGELQWEHEMDPELAKDSYALSSFNLSGMLIAIVMILLLLIIMFSALWKI